LEPIANTTCFNGFYVIIAQHFVAAASLIASADSAFDTSIADRRQRTFAVIDRPHHTIRADTNTDST